MADGTARVPLSFVILKFTFERNVVANCLLCDHFWPGIIYIYVHICIVWKLPREVSKFTLNREAHKVTLTNRTESFVL